MKGKDRAVVAVILVAALIGGLLVVRHALDLSQQAQTAGLTAAQVNGRADGAAESPQTSETGPGEAGDPETSPEAVPSVQPSAQASAQAASAGAGGEAPSMGGGAATLTALISWMQNESGGALAARTQLAAETALASGVGSGDDALRRTFAQSQSASNDEARRNLLAEQAATLGLDYLRCRELLVLQEESVAFYQALAAEIQKESATQAAQPGETAGAAPSAVAAPVGAVGMAPLSGLALAAVVTSSAQATPSAGAAPSAQATPSAAPSAQATPSAGATPAEMATPPAETAESAEADQSAGRAERALADEQTVRDTLAQAELARAKAQADLETAAQALGAAVGDTTGAGAMVTGELSADALPALSAAGAASQAVAARNEVKAAANTLEREERTLEQLRYQYPVTAPEYLSQQAAVEEAKAALPKAKSTVEADVRDRLTRLELSEQELALIAAALERSGTAAPEPAYALTVGGDQTWTSNLSDLTGRWAGIVGDRTRQIAGIARLNLDILCFEHAVGAGCVTATI